MTEGFTAIGCEKVTMEMVAGYAKATGDWNPVHFDDEAAQKLGFDRAFAHGGLITGIVSGMLARHFGPGSIVKRAGVSFHKPVYVGESIGVHLRIIQARGPVRRIDVEVRRDGYLVVQITDMVVAVPTSKV